MSPPLMCFPQGNVTPPSDFVTPWPVSPVMSPPTDLSPYMPPLLWHVTTPTHWLVTPPPLTCQPHWIVTPSSPQWTAMVAAKYLGLWMPNLQFDVVANVLKGAPSAPWWCDVRKRLSIRCKCSTLNIECNSAHPPGYRITFFVRAGVVCQKLTKLVRFKSHTVKNLFKPEFEFRSGVDLQVPPGQFEIQTPNDFVLYQTIFELSGKFNTWEIGEKLP